VVHLGLVTVMQLMGVPFLLPPARQTPITYAGADHAWIPGIQ